LVILRAERSDNKKSHAWTWITAGEGAGIGNVETIHAVARCGPWGGSSGRWRNGATVVLVHSTRAVAARHSRWIHARFDSVRNAIGDAVTEMEMPVLLLLPVSPLVQHEMSSAVVVAVVAVFHEHEAHTSAAYAAVITDSILVTTHNRFHPQFTVTATLPSLESLVVACVMDVAVTASACNCNKASNSTLSSVPLASTSAIQQRNDCKATTD
jgi:hypothetical protein